MLVLPCTGCKCGTACASPATRCCLTQNGLPCFNTGGYPTYERSVFVPQTRYDISPRVD